MSKGRVKPSLITLSRESYKGDEGKLFVNELLGSSDRACAIVGASYVERSLILLIQTKMREFTKPESDALFFEDRAILKTFSERTEIAYALELITKEEKRTLDIIRRIRNAFAHAIRPITFENDLIKAACESLPRNDFKETEETRKLNQHRRKYIECVVTMGGHLARVFRPSIHGRPRSRNWSLILTRASHSLINSRYRIFSGFDSPDCR